MTILCVRLIDFVRIKINKRIDLNNERNTLLCYFFEFCFYCTCIVSSTVKNGTLYLNLYCMLFWVLLQEWESKLQTYVLKFSVWLLIIALIQDQSWVNPTIFYLDYVYLITIVDRSTLSTASFWSVFEILIVFYWFQN